MVKTFFSFFFYSVRTSEAMNNSTSWIDVGISNHCNESYNTGQESIIVHVGGILGICSFLSCFVAIVTVLVLHLHRHFIYRLAVYQVLGSLFESFVKGLGLIVYTSGKLLHNHFICTLDTFLQQTSLWVKLMFTVWLTFHLFAYIVFFKNLKKLEWLYISSSVLIPLLIALIPLIHNSYGLSGAWCYIRSWKDNCATQKYLEGIVEQFALYYGPAMFFLTLSVIAVAVMIVVMVHRALKSRTDDEFQPLVSERNQKFEVLKQLLPLLSYPVIYFALIFFPIFNWIYMAAADTTMYAFLVVHAVTVSAKGFFAGLALILHVCVVKCKRHTKKRIEADQFATCSGVTSYTSGAVTKYSLPNETDIDYNHGRAS